MLPLSSEFKDMELHWDNTPISWLLYQLPFSLTLARRSTWHYPTTMLFPVVIIRDRRKVFSQTYLSILQFYTYIYVWVQKIGHIFQTFFKSCNLIRFFLALGYVFKKITYDGFNFWILLIVTIVITGCLFDNIEEDDSDLVQTNPPPISELQPGRILSNENININGDGTGNFRTHCLESFVNNDDPLVHPGQTSWI